MASKFTNWHSTFWVISFFLFIYLRKKYIIFIFFRLFICKKLYGGSLRKNSKRNNNSIIARTKGGRKKRLIRLINNRIIFLGIPCIIISFLKDSTKNIILGLTCYLNGILTLNVSTYGEVSNRLRLCGYFPGLYKGFFSLLKNLPKGGLIHSIELRPGNGSQLTRSGGCSSVILKRNPLKGMIKLRSKINYELSSFIFCFYGQASNINLKFFWYRNAGHARNSGLRPIVRGIARNPVDHPNGGRTPGGKVYKTLWGFLAKGKKIFKKKKIKKYFKI